MSDHYSLAVLLPILFHRIGLIISFVSAVVLVALPAIYSQPDDSSFASIQCKWLLHLTRLGLVILVISGLIRLQFGIPSRFIFKGVAVLITLIWVTWYPPSYPSSTYQRDSLVLLGLICLSAVMGILL